MISINSIKKEDTMFNRYNKIQHLKVLICKIELRYLKNRLIMQLNVCEK